MNQNFQQQFLQPKVDTCLKAVNVHTNGVQLYTNEERKDLLIHHMLWYINHVQCWAGVE